MANRYIFLVQNWLRKRFAKSPRFHLRMQVSATDRDIPRDIGARIPRNITLLLSVRETAPDDIILHA